MTPSTKPLVVSPLIPDVKVCCVNCGNVQGIPYCNYEAGLHLLICHRPECGGIQGAMVEFIADVRKCEPGGAERVAGPSRGMLPGEVVTPRRAPVVEGT